MERKRVIEVIRAAVAGFYDADESRVVAYEVAERFCGFNRAQALADPAAEAVFDEEELEGACRDLAAGRPLQYVTGEAQFCGFRFGVREGVLIPRPETEELADWIVMECGGSVGLKILDVGTGSGAIAVTLSLSLENASVEGVDISTAALEVAAANARDNGADVKFAVADILSPPDAFACALLHTRYDIIVSNPPYIPRSEYASMRDNVRLYEPAEALFVRDSDPLLYYRETALKARELLTVGGRLFFETHEKFAGEVCGLLSSLGFQEVECRKDINGKPRMVKCTK